MRNNKKTNAGINLSKLEREANERGISLTREDNNGDKWLNFDILPSNYGDADNEVYVMLALGKDGRELSKEIGSIGRGKVYLFKGKKQDKANNFEDTRSRSNSQFNF